MNVHRLTPKLYALLLLGALCVPPLAGARAAPAWNYGFVLAMLALALLLCARRLHLSISHNRPLWSLLLGTLLAQGAAFALLLADTLRPAQGAPTAFDPAFYFCLGSLGMIAAAAYNPLTPMRRWATATDGVLACAIVALFYLMLHRPLAANARYAAWLVDAMGLFVALFATLRLVSARRADERRFHVALAAFAWADTLVLAVHDHFAPAGASRWPEWLPGLPFVALGLLLGRRRTAWPRHRPTGRTRWMATGLAPLMLSLALCALGFAQLGRDRPLATTALILAVAAYGVRTTVLLGYHQAVEEQLRGLRRDLHYKSVRDELTGLLNRAGFRQVLRRAWQDAVRARQALAIAVVDVDNFKSFNDTYGHLAGDDCLSLVAHALRAEAGAHPGVVVARYGGEEFVVLLGGRESHGAEAVVQRLRLHVESLQVRHINAVHGVVTISAGLAVMAAGTALASEKLLRAADEALFEAKRGGRNQVRCAGPTAAPAMATA